MRLTRRTWLGVSAAGAAGALVGSRLGAAEPSGQPEPIPNDAPFDFALPEVGRVKPVSSKAIEASPLSVGFEVLDRRCFEPERTYEHLAALGVKWARCQTGWNRCETKPGQFDFAWLDAVVDSLLKIGVQPWFNLGYDNKLYFPDKPDEQSVGWAPVFRDDQQAAWLRFVARVAEHFRDRVRHWEIWNEPNIPGFWKPQKPSAADYVRLVRITAPEIRRRVPDAVLIGGAFAGIPMGYIQGCLDAGLAGLVDRISYHPYRPLPETGYEAEVQKLRAMIAERNPKVAIWQGENGCPSRGGTGSMGAMANLPWNETRQAKWLLRRIASDLRLGLELTSYFHAVDLQGYRTGTNFKGLLRGGQYTPKPAYFAFQCLCALFDAKTKRADLKPVLVGQDRVRLQDAGFVRDGHAFYAWWYPASLLEAWQRRTITVRLTLPPGVKLDSPALIDPISGRAYRFDRARVEGPATTLPDLPLLEYPLLLTDAATAGIPAPRA